MTEKKLGYFSPEAKARRGSVIWERPDGSTVEVTHTATDAFPCLVEDAECLGEVVRHVSGCLDIAGREERPEYRPITGIGPRA